ncbi:MAG: hypothetical protein ACD_50C00208G0002 [uncultured bacterium]|nr:MAG: hypothetical protein ACD_50C00208G0002 [uncultured bacterium]OGH13101.1 MAG: hypothetical protein A2687_00375 [Candidatus Levybacteria bacterium RIFCSPHIGHO2_01_FULL_38_26]
MKRVLITGVTGFAGSHLAEFLISKNEYDVSGTYLYQDSIAILGETKDKIRLVKSDLTKEDEVNDLLKSVKPDYIFHLAALASPAASFKNPLETIENNIAAQINLFSKVLSNKLLDARILVISSAEVYGLVSKKSLPMDEDTELMPSSPYAVSKLSQDFLGLQYYLSYNLKVVRVRPFNHIGPRQSSNFVVADFARKIAEIEKKIVKPVIHVGNLTAKRDFTDVRDVVRAYVLAIEKGKLGEAYNIGSEKSYKISDILDKLLGMSSVKIEISTDKEKFRPVDIPELLCDASKFKKLTNWKPKIPIEVTLKDTLDYWRKIV